MSWFLLSTRLFSAQESRSGTRPWIQIPRVSLKTRINIVKTQITAIFLKWRCAGQSLAHLTQAQISCDTGGLVRFTSFHGSIQTQPKYKRDVARFTHYSNSYTNSDKSHKQWGNEVLCDQQNTAELNPLQAILAIVPSNCIGIRNHVHHHLLW